MGKTALITGAGRGIGLAIAKRLAANGAKIIINDLNSELLDVLDPEWIKIIGDASDQNIIEEMVSYQPDWVVANAGITLFGDFLNYQRGDFESVMRTNLLGTFFLVQAAANNMIKRKSGGSMVLLSSVTAHQAHLNLAAYGMSKAGIENLVKHLVLELKGHAIHINAIAPGATLTERTLSDPDYATTWSNLHPSGRANYPVEIADTVAFLLSPSAAQINGQTIIIDGGWTSVSPSPY
jgi:glucose 1-dehydrogenase